MSDDGVQKTDIWEAMGIPITPLSLGDNVRIHLEILSQQVPNDTGKMEMETSLKEGHGNLLKGITSL